MLNMHFYFFYRNLKTLLNTCNMGISNIPEDTIEDIKGMCTLHKSNQMQLKPKNTHYISHMLKICKMSV